MKILPIGFTEVDYTYCRIDFASVSYYYICIDALESSTILSYVFL